MRMKEAFGRCDLDRWDLDRWDEREELGGRESKVGWQVGAHCGWFDKYYDVC